MGETFEQLVNGLNKKELEFFHLSSYSLRSMHPIDGVHISTSSIFALLLSGPFVVV